MGHVGHGSTNLHATWMLDPIERSLMGQMGHGSHGSCVMGQTGQQIFMLILDPIGRSPTGQMGHMGHKM